MLVLAFFGTAHAAPSANEQATKRHVAQLVAGAQPKLAKLTLFFTQMPKGGDPHHHYFGAVYAERYLEWGDRQNYCINKNVYRIETGKQVIETERAKAAGQRS